MKLTLIALTLLTLSTFITPLRADPIQLQDGLTVQVQQLPLNFFNPSQTGLVFIFSVVNIECDTIQFTVRYQDNTNAKTYRAERSIAWITSPLVPSRSGYSTIIVKTANASTPLTITGSCSLVVPVEEKDIR